MMYEPQTEAWVDRWGVRPHLPMQGALVLNIEDLILQTRRLWGVVPESITMLPDVTQPVEVYLNRNLGSFYLDAYSGTIIGQPSHKVRQFFRRVRKWHVSLGVSGAHRPVFHGLIVVADAALFLLAMAGIYLWIPRRWTWTHLRPIILPQWGKKGRPRDFNWHNALGIWSVIPIIVIAWTGMAMSGGWASWLTYRIADTLDRLSARERAVAMIAQTIDETEAVNVRPSNLNALWSRAKQQSAHWKAITMYLPRNDAAPVDFAIDMSGYRGIGKISALELNRAGQVLSFTAAGSGGIPAATFIRYGHTGEAWGLPTLLQVNIHAALSLQVFSCASDLASIEDVRSITRAAAAVLGKATFLEVSLNLCKRASSSWEGFDFKLPVVFCGLSHFVESFPFLRCLGPYKQRGGFFNY